MPKLLEYLGPAKNPTKWKRCYYSSKDGFDADDFHKGCDSKGATVTLVRVDNFTFGGYIDVPWESRKKCVKTGAYYWGH